MNFASASDQCALLRAVLKTDLHAFVQASFPIVSGGAVFSDNWHLEAMAYALQRVASGDIRRLIINVPPRSLKSIYASVCFPAFLLGRNPARKIIGVSYSDALSRKHANDCRALMRSQMYRGVFPNMRIDGRKDTEAEIATTARGFRLSTSVGGTLTGRGGDIVIIDDPQKPQDAHSEAGRESVKQWFENTLVSRLDNKTTGAIVVVMQRLHPDDLSGHLLEKGGWVHLNLPAIAEEDAIIELGPARRHTRRAGEALHAAREPLQTLEEIKRGMGAMEFAAQYQQAPVAAGGNLVKWSWFKFYQETPRPQNGDTVIVSWDTASSSRELADYSACVVLLKRRETLFVLDVIRERLEFPQLRRRVIELHRKWRAISANYELIIENKGSGQSLMQDLKQQGIYAIPIDPDGDKQMRMAAQSAKIEAGAVHLPQSASWLDDFKKEVLAFPSVKHDDQVDAFSQALKRTSRPTSPEPMFGTYGR